MSKRDEYIEKIKQQLDEWNSELDELEQKTKQAEGEAKRKLEEKVGEMRAHIDDAEAMVEKLLGAADELWEGIKLGVESAADKIREARNRD